MIKKFQEDQCIENAYKNQMNANKILRIFRMKMLKCDFLKKIFLNISCLVALMLPYGTMAQSKEDIGILDESVQDLTVVVGAGAVGAVLGLSTLSFVEIPKNHFKNIAVGGALGIVVGVGIVIFGQATKSQSIVSSEMTPINQDSFESLSKKMFIAEQNIAQDYLKPPTFSFSLNF